jgi:hypothetical protein
MAVALSAGTYTLVLTDTNYQPGAIYNKGLLSEPFVDLTGGAGQFQTCDPVVDVCINPSGNYAVDIVSSQQTLVAYSRRDVNQDSVTNVSDVPREIEEALGTAAPANYLKGDGAIRVVDVQIDINAALNLGCAAKSDQGAASRFDWSVAFRPATLVPAIRERVSSPPAISPRGRLRSRRPAPFGAPATSPSRPPWRPA